MGPSELLSTAGRWGASLPLRPEEGASAVLFYPPQNAEHPPCIGFSCKRGGGDICHVGAILATDRGTARDFDAVLKVGVCVLL